MNRTTDNTALVSCDVAFLPITPAKISPNFHTILTVRIVVNALTCPLITLLNILVMVAVKTKRQLCTKSNVALACLATTDLMVGLVVQPLQIASEIFVFQGDADILCSLNKVTNGITAKCLWASLYHLLLLTTERYLAIKHPFVHESQVTRVRIIIVSGLAWAGAIILPIQGLWLTKRQLLKILAVTVMFLLVPAMVYFNVVVYMEVRRSEKKIAANQVSLEAKEKILKNKKAFYTTTIVLFLIFLCYMPPSICLVILISLEDRIPANVRLSALYLVRLLPVLNSLFNPLIYSVRIRHFRVTFIQLLSRKTIAQAEELERKIFGSKQIRGIANVQQEQSGAGQEENKQQGNDTLINGHLTTARTQSQEEYEETPL